MHDDEKSVAALFLAQTFRIPLERVRALLADAGVQGEIIGGFDIYPRDAALAAIKASGSDDDTAAAPIASPLRPAPEHIAKLTAAGTGDELPTGWHGRFQGVLG